MRRYLPGLEISNMTTVVAYSSMTKIFRIYTGFIAIAFLSIFFFVVILGKKYETILVAIWATAPFILGMIGGLAVRKSSVALRISLVGLLFVFSSSTFIFLNRYYSQQKERWL